MSLLDLISSWRSRTKGKMAHGDTARESPKSPHRLVFFTEPVQINMELFISAAGVVILQSLSSFFAVKPRVVSFWASCAVECE